MARKGALSPKTIFPGTGDTFEDDNAGICWECVRSHSFHDEVAKRVRYALLKGYCGSDILWMPVHDFDREWLKSISAVTRPEEGGSKRYTWAGATETWQEVA